MKTTKKLHLSFNVKGFKLMGTLHTGPINENKTGVILINAGPTDRAGPHRLYIKLAEFLSREGYPVLRFDPRGTGESEGYWENVTEYEPIAEIHSKVMDGAWIEDTHAAIDVLIDHTGVNEVILCGLCGGAITALLAGAIHEKVRRMCFLGMPITYSSMAGDVGELPDEIIERDFKNYILNLFRPTAWLRFLTFKTDYKTLIGVLKVRIGSLFTKSKNEESKISEKITPYFIESYLKSTKSNKILLFIYAENDYLYKEFQQYFINSSLPQNSDSVILNVIPESNHIMTEGHWQEKLFEYISVWFSNVDKRDTQWSKSAV